MDVAELADGDPAEVALDNARRKALAVEAARQVIGATDPVQAAPGSIRGDLAIEVGQNMVHGSDSPESAAREVGLFFPGLG